MNAPVQSALRILAFALAGLALLAACTGEPSTLPDRQVPQRVARGQLLLAQYQCGSCHAIPGVAASRGKFGPSLEAFGLRSYIAGQVPNGQQALTQWIVNPQSLVPATAMPSMGVSATDARDMAAYLHSLK